MSVPWVGSTADERLARLRDARVIERLRAVDAMIADLEARLPALRRETADLADRLEAIGAGTDTEGTTT